MNSFTVRNAQRFAYRAAIGAGLLAMLPLRARDGRLAVCYGGARAGDVGGTLVKVRQLSSRFPEQWMGLSLLYVLSNAIYVPNAVLKAVKVAGVPIVLNQNGVFYRGWYPRGWQRENARMAKVHAIADHVLYQSEFCRRCARQFLGERTGSSEICYNAVDTAHFVPFDNRRPPRPFTFLVTGKIGLSTAYRLYSSIAGLAAARRGGLDVHLAVAGAIEPSVATQAEVQATHLGVRAAVTFSGPYTARQAPAIYRAADAYLMTKHNDPCPNAVIEAMASGLPVLFSASGGVPELVGSAAGVGLAVPETFEEDLVPSPQAIAEGMARVMQNREAMGRAARARAVEHFDLKNWFARHEAVFQNLLSGKAPA